MSPALFPLLFALASSAMAEDRDLARQDSLAEWWRAAGRLRLDEAAYRIEEPTRFQDGVCTAVLNKGIAIPVWSGEPPLSEHIVGFVYIGEGELEMAMPLRADRWRVANHLDRYDLKPEEIQRAIARDGQPLRLGIERGLVLSADPKVRDFLVGLEPVGGGTMIQIEGEGADGSDESFLVTESRGKLTAQAIATNLLPNRRLHLQRMGIDPRLWIRQDRMLHDEFGLPGDALRLVSDWRTDMPMHVAAVQGAGLAAREYDRWLTCFRDPLDQEGLGFRSMAFAHGSDTEGMRHFERFSGQLLSPLAERSGAWMEPVDADVTVVSRPKGLGSERFVEVDGIIELRAVHGPVRQVTLSMPAGGAVRGTWTLEQLSTMDGKELARMALTDHLGGQDRRVAELGAEEGADDSEIPQPEAPTSVPGGAPASSSPTFGGGGGISTAPQSGELPPMESVAADLAGQFGAGEEQGLVQDAPLEHILQVILPEEVPEGQTTKIRFKWSGRWHFANWSNGGEVLGTTTGLQELAPVPIPVPGGGRWHTRIRVGIPAVGLTSVAVAVVGETVREWDEDTWTWVEAEGDGVRQPAVALGRWVSQLDPPGSGMPGVRVHLFSRDAWALPQFGPEVRRVLAFLDRFLPSFPLEEVEVFQGPSIFTGEALTGTNLENGSGLIAVKTVKTRSVTQQGQIDEVDPYFTQTMIARQVATQYWGEHLAPTTARDGWLVEALAEAFSAFYVRGAFGNEAYEQRMQALRKLVEDPVDRASEGAQVDEINRNRRFLSLTGATTASDVSRTLRRRYGAYVAADMLRLRLGDGAFFSALDRLAQNASGATVSTEQVHAALEEGTGEDLDDVFDWWVHGGFVPEVRVEYTVSAEPDGATWVSGCVRATPRWGSWDLPLVIEDRKGERSVSALVDVDDGLGSFQLSGREGEIEVKADPLGLVLAYARKVERVQRLDCALASPEAPPPATAPLP